MFNHTAVIDGLKIDFSLDSYEHQEIVQGHVFAHEVYDFEYNCTELKELRTLYTEDQIQTLLTNEYKIINEIA